VQVANRFTLAGLAFVALSMIGVRLRGLLVPAAAAAPAPPRKRQIANAAGVRSRRAR
jgi:hypothetical protein